MEAMYTEYDLNLARLAAYIDGEGTIDLQGSSQGKSRAFGYKLRILVYNTDLRMLVWCKEHFGGSVRSNRKGTDKYPPLYMWEITCQPAMALLGKCLPFFVIKREQAEIGIAFGKTFSPSKHSRKKLPDSIKQERESLRTKIFEIRRVKPESKVAGAA
jgi:hypothetical protein